MHQVLGDKRFFHDKPEDFAGRLEKDVSVGLSGLNAIQHDDNGVRLQFFIFFSSLSWLVSAAQGPRRDKRACPHAPRSDWAKYMTHLYGGMR